MGVELTTRRTRQRLRLKRHVAIAALHHGRRLGPVVGLPLARFTLGHLPPTIPESSHDPHAMRPRWRNGVTSRSPTRRASAWRRVAGPVIEDRCSAPRRKRRGSGRLLVRTAKCVRRS
jgi:hypothetical protein